MVSLAGREPIVLTDAEDGTASEMPSPLPAKGVRVLRAVPRLIEARPASAEEALPHR